MSSKKLAPQQLVVAARAAGFETRAVRAVLKLETGVSGYDKKSGYLLIQFESSWFRSLLPRTVSRSITSASTAVVKQTATPGQAALAHDWVTTQANIVEGQIKERLAFDAAVRIDERTAQLATSWGLPQMMGFNHEVCGYASVSALIEAFRESEANQLMAMLRFFRLQPRMAAALKKGLGSTGVLLQRPRLQGILLRQAPA